MVPTDGVFQSVLDGWPESSFPHHHLWRSPPYPLWTDDAWDPGEVSNIQEDVPKPSRDREIWLECSMSQEASPLRVNTRPSCSTLHSPRLPRSSSLLELYRTCRFWLRLLSPGCPGAGSFHVYENSRGLAWKEMAFMSTPSQRRIRSRLSRRVSSGAVEWERQQWEHPGRDWLSPTLSKIIHVSSPWHVTSYWWLYH